MNKILTTILLQIIFANCITAQSSYTLTYNRSADGKKLKSSSFLFQNNIAYLSEPTSNTQNILDFKKKQFISVVNLKNKFYKTITPFDSIPKPTPGNKTEKILGYDCKYVSYNSFSNLIEVWYTEATIAKGSPYRTFLPSPKALVMKIIVNGNSKYEVASIEQNKSLINREVNLADAKKLSNAELEEIKINARFHKMPIFTQEIINFSDTVKKHEKADLLSDITYRFSGGTIIAKKIKMPDYYKKDDLVFAKLSVASNGDAYDRTGSVFMISEEPGKTTMLDAFINGINSIPAYLTKDSTKYQGAALTDNYIPPVELMRFFTSFGAGYFNKQRAINNYPFKDASEYKADISELIPKDGKEFWVCTYIGNYSKGGHLVNLEFDIYPGDSDAPKLNLYTQPLFFMVNVMEMSGQAYGKLFKQDSLTVNFTVPENLHDLKLVFTTTGHGGWGGGDEFNQKLNQILVDGKPIFSIYPWRTDCAAYRLYNPASGNFENGMSSSDYSRSNWCPATLTLPYVIPLPQLSAGKHQVQVAIDLGKDEGGSFSHWNVSGVLVGKR